MGSDVRIGRRTQYPCTRILPDTSSPFLGLALAREACSSMKPRTISLRDFGRATVCATMSVLLPACTTVRLSEPQQAAPSAHAATTDQSGLVLTADPWLDRARTEEYFGIDAAAVGLVIVRLKATNQSSPDTFLLHKDNFRLALAGADLETSDSVKHRSKTGDAANLTGALLLVTGPAILLSLPLMFGGAKMASNASRVQHNFVERELGNQTLSPGQVAEGFIYFKLPDNQKPGSGFRFVVNLLNTRTQETLRFEFPLPNEN